MTTTTTYNVAPLVEHFAHHVDSELLPLALIILVIVALVAFIWSKRPKWMPQ